MGDAIPAEAWKGRLRLAASLANEVKAQRSALRKVEDRLFAVLSADLPGGSPAASGAPAATRATPEPGPGDLPPSHPSKLVPRVSAVASDPRRVAPQDSSLVEALIDLTRAGERPANREGIIAAPTRGQTLADAVVAADFDAGRREAEWALGGPPSGQTRQEETASRFALDR